MKPRPLTIFIAVVAIAIAAQITGTAFSPIDYILAFIGGYVFNDEIKRQ